MLPHKHFVISSFVIAITALFFQVGWIEGVYWVLIGGAVAMLLDIDAIIAAYTDKKLKGYGIVQVFRDYEGFLEKLKKTKILNRLMFTHFVLAAAVSVVSFIFARRFFFPVVIGVIVHLFSDVYSLLKEDNSESF